jgi:hypothetical protein
MSMDHVFKCREVLQAVSTVLRAQSDDGVTNEQKLCRLSSVLQNQNSGTRGAGLTGGQLQEALWVGMLTLGDRRFAARSPSAVVTDADYYFNDYPISHKTIGWAGSGALALAWSKNPPGGIQRTEFKASMAIALTHRPAIRGQWEGIENGYYLVPLDYLAANIQLSSNNKTDSLIDTRYVLDAMRYAASQSLMIPLTYDHEWGKGKVLSTWRVGLKAVSDAI